MRTVAPTWGVAGLAAALTMPGTLKAGAVLIPVAIAFYYWPSLLRWPILAFVAFGPIGFLARAHVCFHARTSYPLLIWALRRNRCARAPALRQNDDCAAGDGRRRLARLPWTWSPRDACFVHHGNGTVAASAWYTPVS